HSAQVKSRRNPQHPVDPRIKSGFLFRKMRTQDVDALVDVEWKCEPRNEDVLRGLVDDTVERFSEDNIRQVGLAGPSHDDVGNECLPDYALNTCGYVLIYRGCDVDLLIGRGSVGNGFFQHLSGLEKFGPCFFIVWYDG